MKYFKLLKDSKKYNNPDNKALKFKCGEMFMCMEGGKGVLT